MHPQPLCRGSGNAAGCYPAYFSNYKADYNSICGKLKGYQEGSTDGFYEHSSSINGPYLEGVSITVGTPRKHVWSYATGYTKQSHCPCANNNPGNPPFFVKDHYYCESGTAKAPGYGQFLGTDPLWDGNGCLEDDDCCSRLGAPWFYRHFTPTEKGTVEVRICRDQEYSNEATLIEQVELYIQ